MFLLKFIPIPFLLIGCGSHECYVPVYITEYDSVTLANKQKWIVDVVKAASTQMTTSDYEDVDETIQQAEISAERIFPKTVKKYGVAHLDYSFFSGCGGSDCVTKDDFILIFN